MSDVETRIKDLGLTLPPAPTPGGNYVPFVQSGNLVFLAGVVCMANGEMTHTGKVGESHTVETAYEAARVCALNALASMKAAAGSLDAVKRVVMVNGYVNAVEGFEDSPAVINGASDLFVEVLGERGKHARAAVAVSGLPRDTTVEIHAVIEI